MKLWTLIALFVAIPALAQEQLMISEVTEETWDDFLNQYSESCRPLVKRWVAGAAAAAEKFNSGDYLGANSLIERYVRPGDAQRRTGSAAIMFSDDCNDDDLVLTLAQSENLVPMIRSTACMVRVSEGDREWLMAREIFDPDNIDTYVPTIARIENAMYAVDDVMENGLCKYLEQDMQDKIAATRAEWESIRDDIQGYVDDSE